MFTHVLYALAGAGLLISFIKDKKKTKMALFNPLLISVLLIIGLLSALGISYQAYYQSAKILSIFLTPATICLAVPLYEQLDLLKKHKKALKNGAITVSNHVFMWDYLCVLKAIRPRVSYFPAWKPNFENGFQPFIRILGGMPIPEGDIHAMMAFKRGMDEVVESGKWLHVFPEGSLWYFYPDIRPLKPAAFNYAAKYNKPLIPISMSFRPRKGIRKLFGKGPFVDLHISEPLYADKNLTEREAALKLREKTYRIMQEMNGIKPGDPTYNEDQNIENYRATM